MVDFGSVRITPDVQHLIDQNVPDIRVIVSPKDGTTIGELFGRVVGLPSVDGYSVEKTDAYVFATLTPEQITKLAEQAEVKKIWLSKGGIVLLNNAVEAVQQQQPWEDYGVYGDGITWAVLDNGIDGSHEALQDTIVGNTDFTGQGNVGPHGTHMAGIIAGHYQPKNFRGLAPKCKLYNFRVMSQSQSGSELAIKAMAQIRQMNTEADKLVIQGANLSIGYNPEFKMFQPGHSPVCEEANRLVESGVVVCIASGNSGAQAFETAGNVDFVTISYGSLLDPATAQLPITVGSTHRFDPEKYGISFFSSKGPTADGRRKPDLVAPGEKIYSTLPGNRYVPDSGTSQAAAVVSGAAALLLSAYPHLIGNPNKVKEILIATCRDLKRDPNFQGAGIIDIRAALEEAGRRLQA